MRLAATPELTVPDITVLVVLGDPAMPTSWVTVGEHVVSEGLADAFARQLYGDELGYARIGVPSLCDDVVFAKVVSGLGVTGMQNFTAWVHGDTHAERFGVTPVGLPTGAGYAAGNRMVDREGALLVMERESPNEWFGRGD